MADYWNLLLAILAILMFVSGVYYWWVGDTHQMIYAFFMAMFIDQSLNNKGNN